MAIRNLAAALSYTDKHLASFGKTRRWAYTFWRDHTAEGLNHVDYGGIFSDYSKKPWQGDEFFLKGVVLDIQRFVYGDEGDTALGVDAQPATEREMDGKLGPGTFRRMEAWLQSLRPASVPIHKANGVELHDALVFQGKRSPCEGLVVSSLDEPGALSFPRSKKGKKKGYSSWGDVRAKLRSGSISQLATVHWDACLTAKKAHRILCGRNLSSTVGIDNPDPELGNSVVHQWLDPGLHRGHHGGSKANRGSLLSFDMTNAVYLKYQKWYVKNVGAPRPVIKAIIHGKRRYKVMLGMYAEQIISLLRVLKHFHSLVGEKIPFTFPTAGGSPIYTTVPTLFKKPVDFGVHTHMHITRKKWDVASLEDQIMVLLTQRPELMEEFPTLVKSFRLHDEGLGNELDKLRTKHGWVWEEIGWS